MMHSVFSPVRMLWYCLHTKY